YEVFFHFARFGLDDNLAVSTFDFPEGNHPVDFAYHGWVGWVSRFEKFGYPWKTSGNIARFGRFPWNLHQDFPDFDFLGIVHHQVRANRQVVRTDYLVFF